MPLNDIIAASHRMERHRPWPRAVITADQWVAAATRIAAGEATLLGLWGDAGAVHMAVIDEASGEIVIATIECPAGTFPSVGRFHAPAIRLERALTAEFGLKDAIVVPSPADPGQIAAQIGTVRELVSRGYTRAEEMLKNYYGVWGKDLTPLFTEYNFL